jgi:hypothetical protein
MLTLIANDSTHIERRGKPVDARQSSIAHRRIVAPFAHDPELTMRREIKLLRIEVEQLRAVEQMLRVELELLGRGKDDARKTKELLGAYVEEVEQLRESRDYWEQKALSHGWFQICLTRGGDLPERVLRKLKCWQMYQRQTIFTIAGMAVSLIHVIAVWGRWPALAVPPPLALIKRQLSWLLRDPDPCQ